MTKSEPNTLFPGRARYIGPVTGWFGLLHHDILYEQSHNVMERVAYVKRDKPTHEIAIRLHNMIRLDPVLCPAVARRATLDAGYKAKRVPLDDEVLAYIKTQIPNCAWTGDMLVFN